MLNTNLNASRTFMPIPKKKWALCCAVNDAIKLPSDTKALWSTAAPLTTSTRLSGLSWRSKASAHLLFVAFKSSWSKKPPTLTSWLALFQQSFVGVKSIRHTSICVSRKVVCSVVIPYVIFSQRIYIITYQSAFCLLNFQRLLCSLLQASIAL